ncbi:MAG: tyrosine-protein phosphatase [Curvibacter sp.]|nr:tyrosine-protein phosphatase [Curvibacter sp.]
MSTPSPRLSGASNFRDLGGYAGLQGRRLRPGRIYRSDHLARLTPEDRQLLQRLEITRSVDFRGVDERAAQSYDLPGLTQHALSIEPTVVQRAKAMVEAGRQMTAADAVELMQITYRDFVLHNSPRFAALFALLLDNDQPLVFHCTAGKDRTGLAAALILQALGVADEVVLHDYLLTNQLYRRPAEVSGQAPADVLNVLWQVQPPFLEAAMTTIRDVHGGVLPYLDRALGVGPAELERLRSLYLQP